MVKITKFLQLKIKFFVQFASCAAARKNLTGRAQLQLPSLSQLLFAAAWGSKNLTRAAPTRALVTKR